MNIIEIGNYINKCRKEQMITQEQLGEKLGVSFQAVSNWEQGKNLPDTALLIDLAIILNTDVDTILKGGKQKPMNAKKINVRDIIQGIENLSTIKDLLGEDNTFYKYMIEGISKGINTNAEEVLSSNYLREIAVVEILIQNTYSGHYVDPKEVNNLLQYEKTKKIYFDYIQSTPDDFNADDLKVNL